MNWTIINSGECTAIENMKKDEMLLSTLSPSNQPILHLYRWIGDCATYGYFIKPEDHFYLNAIAEHKLEIARRPTGGGIVFHSFDLAFSILIPAQHPGYSLNTLENYAYINSKVLEVIKEFITLRGNAYDSRGGELSLLKQECSSKHGACQQFCMAKPTQYDVMLEGRKVGGAAQRRTKQGYLHQGTIALKTPPKDYLLALLKHGNVLAEAMYSNTYPLISHENEPLEEIRQRIEDMLIMKFLN